MFFSKKKYFEPMLAAINGNTTAINALSDQALSQSAQVSAQFEQLQKVQKELSMQIEELYDCVSDTGEDCDSDVESLVAAVVSMREEIERLREYSLAGNDQDLTRHVELLTGICDRKLSEAGILKIDREGELFNREMDLVSDVEYVADVLPNVNIRVLSGCYKYCGKIVKRSNVIVNKGE